MDESLNNLRSVPKYNNKITENSIKNVFIVVYTFNDCTRV